MHCHCLLFKLLELNVENVSVLTVVLKNLAVKERFNYCILPVVKLLMVVFGIF